MSKRMGQLKWGIPRSPFFQSAAQKSRWRARVRMQASTSRSGFPSPLCSDSHWCSLLQEAKMLCLVHHQSCCRATQASFPPQLYFTSVWPGCVTGCWRGFCLLNETPSHSLWLKQPEQPNKTRMLCVDPSTQVLVLEFPTQPDTCHLDLYGKAEIEQCLIFYLQIKTIVHHLFLETKNLL